MAQVQSVRGPLDTARLGTTLMHEHVFVLSAEIRENYPAYWDEDVRVADAVEKLRELKGAGVDTIVDPTVIGLGRYIPRIARINAQVDINIIPATGIYTYNELPFFFHFRGTGSGSGGEDPMISLFKRDIVEGIAGTGIKAAFLKCAIDAQGMTRGVERAMRAVARTHVETGVPITVHTNVHNQSGLLAQRLLREEDVDLAKVVIGHSGDSTDLTYLRALMDAGSFIGMDRFGLDALLPFEARVETVATLCREGYAERIVLSHDAACYIDWLRERGVSEAQIETMLVDNPRRYFTPAGAPV
jgi:phosphotriesterase-related protein